MYLVAGASSVVGRQVVAKLRQDAHPVRVLVRRDSDAEYFSNMGAEVVQADIRDLDALRRACRQTSIVISLVGRHFSATEAAFREVDVQGNSNLARAGSESHVRHFLLISALWADRDLRPVIFRVKRQAEEAVIRSGLSYTILRPCTFAQGPSSLIGILGPTIERYGLAFVPAPDSRPISFMPIQDLVDAIVCIALNSAAHQHRILELGGAEPVTLIEGATRLAAILQKKLRVIRLPRSILGLMAVFAKRLGFGPYEAMLFLEMLRDHGFFCDAGPLRELLGREPQSLDTVLQEYYRQHRQTAWRDSIFGTLLLRAN